MRKVIIKLCYCPDCRFSWECAIESKSTQKRILHRKHMNKWNHSNKIKFKKINNNITMNNFGLNDNWFVFLFSWEDTFQLFIQLWELYETWLNQLKSYWLRDILVFGNFHDAELIRRDSLNFTWNFCFAYRNWIHK